MTAAAWLAALTETQREKACYAFGDERRDWSSCPRGTPAACRSARSTTASASSRTS
jgi:hypothetical protein